MVPFFLFVKARQCKKGRLYIPVLKRQKGGREQFRPTETNGCSYRERDSRQWLTIENQSRHQLQPRRTNSRVLPMTVRLESSMAVAATRGVSRPLMATGMLIRL
jgi:hypothetical protein